MWQSLQQQVQNQTRIIQEPKSSIQDLDNRLKSQKGIKVDFSEIKNSNHFFKNREEDLKEVIDKYIQKNTELI